MLVPLQLLQHLEVLEDSKNRDARAFPYKALPGLARIIQQQREHTDRVQQARDLIVSHVIHRNGVSIRSFRASPTRSRTTSGVRPPAT